MKPYHLTLAFVLLAACTTGLPDKSATTITQGDAVQGCALGVEGTMAMTEDTADGIAIVFMNPRDVKEVRDRAFDASIMFGTGAKLGKGHNGRHGEGGHHGLKPMQMPPAWTSVTDVDGGARIRFTPVDKADLETLRMKLRERATEMTGACKH